MKWLAAGALLSACASTPPSSTTTTEPSSLPASAPVAISPHVGLAAEPPPDPEPVAGPFSSSRVQEIVRANFDKLAACYERGLERDSKLAGTVNVTLAIDADGTVISSQAPRTRPNGSKDEALVDDEVVGCVETEMKSLRFPPTDRGLVNLIYPVVFRTE